MQTRKFDELISYFNRKVAEMNIDTKYKMELLGMVTALGLEHEKELSAQTERHWTPVTEGLPRERHYDDGDYVEPSDSVLVFTRYKTYYISRYWGHRVTKGETSYEIPDWMDLDEYISDAVVAWMPLPQPYNWKE